MIRSFMSIFTDQKWLSFLLFSLTLNFLSSCFNAMKAISRKWTSGSKMAVIELKGALTEPETVRILEEIELVRTSKYPILCLKLNTPGGIASSCTAIENELNKLKQQRDVKILAFAEGMCCSAGMHIACSAEKIYATRDCIMGSIGVRFDVTDNEELFKKIGLKKHSVAVGEKKKMFENGEFVGKDMLLDILQDSKKQFDEKASRGGLVDTTKEEIASSKIFTTTKALELGLTDKICLDINSVLDDQNSNRNRKLQIDYISNLEKPKRGLFSLFGKTKEKYIMSGLLYLAPFYN